MNILKFLGIGASVNLKEFYEKGAYIIDVRTKGEFNSGHLTGSINIPLDQLEKNISKFNKEDKIIVCCASGMRSASAKNTLKKLGFQEVVNGGGWIGLKRKLLNN